VNTTLTCPCSAAAETKTIKDYSFTLFNSIKEVAETQWNKYIPEANRLMQFEQLQLIETSQSQKMQFAYVFIKKGGDTVGVAYFQIVRFTAADLMNYFPAEPESGAKKYLYRSVKSMSEWFIRSIDLKLLVSGNVFMTGENGFYFNHEVDRKTRGILLRKTIAEVVKTDSRIRAVLISDLYEPKTEFDAGFKQSGFHEITVESDMSIRIPEEWKTFDDYMKALSSKYRVRAKKVLALCNENGVIRKDLSIEEIAEHENRLFELYSKVMDRADFKLASLAKDFFSLQKNLMGDNYRVFAYFKDGSMIGFISLFLQGRKMEVHYTGMDAEICKPIHLYQHMMYDMIGFGIEHRAERLHFGRTAPEIKSTMGAAPSPMYGYVKHLNSIFNFLFVRTFTARLKPKQYTFRNPFK
jgi:predicted N-acyltransferase